jgi:hypothetical protein
VTESVVLPPDPRGGIMPSPQLKPAQDNIRYTHSQTCSIAPPDAQIR